MLRHLFGTVNLPVETMATRPAARTAAYCLTAPPVSPVTNCFSIR